MLDFNFADLLFMLFHFKDLNLANCPFLPFVKTLILNDLMLGYNLMLVLNSCLFEGGRVSMTFFPSIIGI